MFYSIKKLNKLKNKQFDIIITKRENNKRKLQNFCKNGN